MKLSPEIRIKPGRDDETEQSGPKAAPAFPLLKIGFLNDFQNLILDYTHGAAYCATEIFPTE